MSRVAKKPIEIPKGVEVKFLDDQIAVKGPKGEMNLTVNPVVQVKWDEDVEDGESGSGTSTGTTSLVCVAKEGSKFSRAMAGTTRSLVSNMVTGVHIGWERKLTLVGVGYKAQAQGSKLNLALGFSHPVNYELPKGITVETPSATEVVIRGMDKQVVGQVAAEIRAIRPPEPYKGKGVRYFDERVRRKEAKKK